MNRLKRNSLDCCRVLGVFCHCVGQQAEDLACLGRSHAPPSYNAHVCVSLLFRHKCDIRHFVFFVHQEYDGIAFK
jgi:hypothetical protein